MTPTKNKDWSTLRTPADPQDPSVGADRTPILAAPVETSLHTPAETSVEISVGTAAHRASATPAADSAAADRAPVDRRGQLANVLRKLMRSGFVHNGIPVMNMIAMTRAWQGPDENSVIVDMITLHALDQAYAAREGPDRALLWGPKRGSWLEIVAELTALPPPHRYVAVEATGATGSLTATPSDLS